MKCHKRYFVTLTGNTIDVKVDETGLKKGEL